MAIIRTMRWQRTLRSAIEFAGVGLHSGTAVTLQVAPAAANAGIAFHRQDADSLSSRHHVPPIWATAASIDPTKSQLCTQLQAQDGSWNVSTIEHFMAALVAARVTNARVNVVTAGNDRVVELPILDGSALPFMRELNRVGTKALVDAAPARYIRVRRPVEVLQQDKAAWLLPMPVVSGALEQRAPTLNVSVQVNFEHKGLGSQFVRFILGHDVKGNMTAFEREIAPARTFTFEEEIAWMQENGLARGGSLENAVVFRSQPLEDAATDGVHGIRVQNPEGLRFPEDEWARHKLLDCIGDLGLAGLPLHGYYFATSPGHALTHQLVQELLREPTNYDIVEMDNCDH